MNERRILVAGMGNELREDDAFGIEVARRFRTVNTSPAVQIYEAGIAGVALVQELMDGYDALVVVDAVDRSAAPGTIFVLESEVPQLDAFEERDREAFLADTHYTIPSKALILGQALGVLPEDVYIVGCQPASCELGIGMSEPVARAVDAAVRELEELTTKLLQGGIYVSGNPA